MTEPQGSVWEALECARVDRWWGHREVKVTGPSPIHVTQPRGEVGLVDSTNATEVSTLCISVHFYPFAFSPAPRRHSWCVAGRTVLRFRLCPQLPSGLGGFPRAPASPHLPSSFLSRGGQASGENTSSQSACRSPGSDPHRGQLAMRAQP